VTQGVGAQTSVGLLAFQFVRAAPIEATGHVAGVTENPVIRRVAVFPDPAVYRDAGASYGRAWTRVDARGCTPAPWMRLFL
jgi:hypothetical protein